MKAFIRLLASVMALTGGMVTFHAHAASFPGKPITIIVAYPPGGTLDTIGRVVAKKLSEHFGQPVIVENKAGADGQIGTEFVARAEPDGYTLLMGSSAQMVYNPAIFPALRYHPVNDFAPITLLGSFPQALAASPKLGIHSIKEFIGLAKSKPEGLFYSTGASSSYMVGELFKSRGGFKMVNVPYKGSAPAATAAVSSDVALVVADPTTLRAFIQSGKLVPLAVTGAERNKSLPDTPTLIESGVNVQALSWSGLFAPAETPKPVVETLYRALVTVLQADDIKERLATLGYETGRTGMAPADFRAMYQEELAMWTKVVKELDMRIDQK